MIAYTIIGFLVCVLVGCYLGHLFLKILSNALNDHKNFEEFRSDILEKISKIEKRISNLYKL